MEHPYLGEEANLPESTLVTVIVVSWGGGLYLCWGGCVCAGGAVFVLGGGVFVLGGGCVCAGGGCVCAKRLF